MTEPSVEEYMPERPAWGRRILVAVLAVVVVLGAAAVVWRNYVAYSDPAVSRVGDCLRISGSESSPTATRLSCKDNAAMYVVTATARSVTCDSAEDTLKITGRDGAVTTLCLFYNVSVGDCITGDRSLSDTRQPCASGLKKVVKVATGTADRTTCPPESDSALSDAKHPRLVCFVTVP